MGLTRIGDENKMEKPIIFMMILVTMLFSTLSACVNNQHFTNTTPLIPREVLWSNPDKSKVQISPDGTRISYLSSVNGVKNIWVVPLNNLSAAKPVTNDTFRGINDYQWAYTDQHIIYRQDQGGNENWRLYCVNLSSNRIKDLTPFEGVQARVQSINPLFPDNIIVALNDRDPSNFDLYYLNIETGNRTLIMKNNGSFFIFIIDYEFKLRAVGRMTYDGGIEYFKYSEGDILTPFISVPPEDTITTYPIGLNKNGTILHMKDSRDRNTSALYAIDFNTGERTLLAENPKADLSDVMVNPIELNIEAAEFNYERKYWMVLDNSISDDIRYLDNITNGEMEVTSRSMDDRQWIITYTVDNGPVQFYLYNRDTMQAKFLFTDRKELENLSLAKERPAVIKSRDGLDLVSYYLLPVGSDSDNDGYPDVPLPMVLHVHGGPWDRFEWGFTSVHQWLANRGYAVLAVNFRGSTGFGKAFVNAGNLEWGGKMHNDLLDAVDWAIQKGIADPNRIGIIGGSYGGYATLWAMTNSPDKFACGVDLCGVSNLTTFFEAIEPAGHALLEAMYTRVGDSRTEEGRAFLFERSPINYVNQIQHPLLIIHGSNDPRVKQSQSDLIVQSMQQKNIKVMYLVYPDEGHGLVRPENDISSFAVCEAFFSKFLGGRCEPIGNDFDGSSITIPVGSQEIPDVANAISNHESVGNKNLFVGSWHLVTVDEVAPNVDVVMTFYENDTVKTIYDYSEGETTITWGDFELLSNNIMKTVFMTPADITYYYDYKFSNNNNNLGLTIEGKKYDFVKI